MRRKRIRNTRSRRRSKRGETRRRRRCRSSYNRRRSNSKEKMPDGDLIYCNRDASLYAA